MKYIRAIAVFVAGWGLTSESSGQITSPKQQTINPAFLHAGEVRKFSIEYIGKVLEIPPGAKKLRVWIPAPQNTTVQRIERLQFSPPARFGVEKKYDNQIAYWEINQPSQAVMVQMNFVCRRLEVRMQPERLRVDGTDPSGAFRIYKQPDQLVLVDDEIRALAHKVTAGKRTTVEKSRAIYDYVLGKMTYDKNHVGWGFGSTRHACDVGKGNCTDFHALFNSLCRAEGIASGFEIGLYLPYDRNKIEPLGGYHCWASFRVPGKTWVPVDCSEGDRIPERKDYFFGNHTPNRVTLSTGRDITLEPKQDGPPLNYLLDPYAEADGKPVKTEKTWSFQDLD
jgi:transglutaminase-like putative cysteine protease